MAHVKAMMRYVAYLGLALLSLGFAPAAAQQAGGVVQVSILPGWRAEDGSHIAALRFTLQDGWKTYWRSPGDAGIPPQFDWRGSRNLSAVEVTWPTPKPMDQGGVRTIGYTRELILPLRLTPKAAGRAIKLRGEIDMGVCSDICIPVTVSVANELPQAVSKPDPRIVAALADRPYTAAEAGVSHVACRISQTEDGLRLRAEIDLPDTGGNELAVFEADDPMIWIAQARTVRQGGRLVAETDLYHTEGRAFALNRSGLRITVLGQRHAVDIRGCPAG